MLEVVRGPETGGAGGGEGEGAGFGTGAGAACGGAGAAGGAVIEAAGAVELLEELPAPQPLSAETKVRSAS